MRECAEDIDIQRLFETQIQSALDDNADQIWSTHHTCSKPQVKKKMNFNSAVLNTAVQSAEKIFQQLNKLSPVLVCLYKVHSLHNKTSKQIMLYCLKLYNMSTPKMLMLLHSE
ncbi:hypothetical protein L798_09062 [Zootermopsis nevadensis]|uniref:Uncharacterized protein n=1 Tax=Zootermopsis nevadensis TaxID=136037 RepID=A0A067R255_ZOONE|nr:hypothetical protein L798_09062 [Zootermopsis nevadensis]